MDPDVSDCAGYATRRLDELIARPAKPGETDDMPLIIENLRYDPQAPGGSHADYIADHIEPHTPAYRSKRLTVRNWNRKPDSIFSKPHWIRTGSFTSLVWSLYS